MLNLPRPTHWYFETCRQIIWCRLTFDKLYVLYSNNARNDLETIWRTALRRTIAAGSLVDVETLLDDTMEADDREWRDLVKAISGKVDIEQAVNDYFLGADVVTIVNEIEGGGYRGL